MLSIYCRWYPHDMSREGYQTGKSVTGFKAVAFPDVPPRLDGVVSGSLSDWSPPAETGEAAMATVYVVTAGSGETHHIERVYLGADLAYGFAHDYNGSAPVEPVAVEKWQVGAPTSRL